MRRVDQEPVLVDKRAEIARAYYPDGVLKAERYRVLERHTTALRIVDEPRGFGWFLSTWLKCSATVLIVAILIAMGGILWEPWGALAASAGIGLLIALHWD